LGIGYWLAKALIITSESSEVDVFSKTKFGYNACKTSNLFVSDLEPEIFSLKFEE
jgi:hypothetical protein